MKSQDYINVMGRVRIRAACRTRILTAAAQAEKGHMASAEAKAGLWAHAALHGYAAVAAVILLLGTAVLGFYSHLNESVTGSQESGVQSVATPDGKANGYPKNIPILAVTEEWKEQVYFGADFPYIVYADGDLCIFTEGSDSIFFYEFQHSGLGCTGTIGYAGNIRESLLAAGISEIGGEGWNGISFLAGRMRNGAIRPICSVMDTKTQQVCYYHIDRAKERMTLMDAAVMQDVTLLESVENEKMDYLNIFSQKGVYAWAGGYACLMNNGKAQDVQAGYGSHLPMISILRYDGDSWLRFDPFPDLYNDPVSMVQETEQCMIGWHDFIITLPHEFTRDETEGETISWQRRLPNQDTVYFCFYDAYAAGELQRDASTPAEVVDLLLPYVVCADAEVGTSPVQAIHFDASEEIEVAGYPFLHGAGMLTRADGSYHYEAYFGVIPSTNPASTAACTPVMWMAFSDTERTDTLQYLHEVAENAAAHARLIPDLHVP